MGKSLLWALAALVGTPAVAAAAPAWCKPIIDAKERTGAYHEREAKGEEPRDAALTIVSTICNPFDPRDVPAAEAARKAWSAKLDMTDEDWLGAAEYEVKYNPNANPIPPNQPGYTKLDPLDQFLLIVNNTSTTLDGYYVADAMGPLSEAGRLGYAIWCVGHGQEDAHIAACIHDVEAIDAKKIAAEVRADKTHEPRIGFIVRMALYRSQKQFAELKAKAAALKKMDPAYPKMFDIAEQAFKDWDANAGKRADLLAFAGDMDNLQVTQSRKAQAGCEDKAITLLRGAVATIPAAHFASAISGTDPWRLPAAVSSALVATPEGYLAASAYLNCQLPGWNYNSEYTYFVESLGDVLVHWAGYRGPRSAAISDVMQAGLELDKRDLVVNFPRVDRSWFGKGHPSFSSKSELTGFGVIASVKPDGKRVKVSFNNKKVTNSVCTKYTAGTKITGVMSNGQFERAGTCSEYKKVTEAMDVEPKPVDARFASGLAAGQMSVSINLIPYASWLPGAKVPSTILGVPVK